MNKKRWCWGGLSALLLAAVLFIVYGRYSSDGYLKMLPSRPKVLVSIDMVRLAEESELDAKTLAGFCPPEWREAKTGIDWTQKMYAFVSSKEYLGLLAAVSDAGELEDFLQKMSREGRCRPVEQRMGYSWTVLNDRWLMGFDKHALMVMGPGFGGDMNVMQQDILKCFRQSKEDSGMSSVLYEGLLDANVAMAFITRMEMLPEYCHRIFQEGLPEHANLNDITFMATLDFTKTGVEINGEVNSLNPAVNKYFSRLSQLGNRIQGVYAKDVPEDALAWGCINVDGEHLLEQLRNIPDVRTFLFGLNMGVDADRMIRSIDGDVAVTLWAPKGLNSMDYLVTAQIENKDFLNEADYWTQSAARNSALTLDNLGDDRFFMSTDDLRAYFGVEGKTLYLTSTEQSVPDGGKDTNMTLSAWDEEMKADCFFLWLNLERLKQEPEMGAWIMALNGSSWKETVDMFSSVTLRSSDVRHINLNINTNSKRQVLGELLKQWIK